ncbi:MAG: UvrD-helicase domain-containing protein [Fibrobacterota bacterium]|nr:UvrD-helicase domain-containing protein [Fibrobacterota bacterium]
MKDKTVPGKAMASRPSAGSSPVPVPEDRPEAVAALDLTKPGLLEASAGTGKTYAIEHLVLRLLIESENLALQDILVLTFTEKATGELKDKIRGRIAWRIAKGGLAPDIMARLKLAHHNFDRASIHTIHGFCQRVLRKYAFENNALFSQELVKNVREVLERVLFEEMRSTWLSEAGPGSQGLEAFRSKANALGLGPNSKWAKRLIDIALDFNPLRGDTLLPNFDPARITALEAEASWALRAIAGMFPHLKAGTEADHAFTRRYRDVKFASKTTRFKAPQVVESVLRITIDYQAAGNEEARTAIAMSLPAKVAEAGLTGIRSQGFSFLMPTAEECPDLPWPELVALLAHLDRIRAAAAQIEKERSALAFADQRAVITGLRAKAQAHLRSNGFITYDSMIEDVCLALREKDERVSMLRRDYRYCLVDEFQDTDPLQWEIFRRVFLQSGSANPLYLIGDPKQAIYRFRGGDVYTYMEARKEIFALSREGKAQGFGLDTNYRSSGAMVKAYNAAFTHTGWFHSLALDPGDTVWRLPAEPDPLGYLPVKYGDLPIQQSLDATGTPAAIILKDFSGASPDGRPGTSAPRKDPEKTAVKKRVNHWIASEIAALMASPERLQIPDRTTGRLRPLAWGDICVLVRKNPEKIQLERVLGEAGIPVQVNRRSGLYQGDAAGQFLAVLESLEDPRDAGKHARALLTRFFRADGDAPPTRAPESPHPLFEEWIRLASRRRWQRLFHCLLYKTGLLYRESLHEDSDRRIMDFTHIGQNLVREALSKNLSLPALVLRLRDLRAAPPGADEDVDMHREESEGGKVVLMTMHVSKGLEFPVVFLACFSGNPPATHYKYRAGLNTVFNLDKDDTEARKAFQDESDGEDRRLFYVALTRARYKLYVPVLPKGGAGNASTGPLGGFVAEALRTAASLKPDLYHWAPPEDYAQAPTLVPRVSSESPAMPGRPASSDRTAPFTAEDPLAGYPREDLLARPEADFSKRRRRLNSYSHLVRHSHGLAAETVEGRFDKEEAPVTAGVPEDAENMDPAVSPFPGNALPRGKDVGNMFHEILERIDFNAVLESPSPEALFAHAPTRDLIHGCMEDHRMEETWRAGVAGVVWNTLRARIPDPAGGAPFSLAEVSQRRPEMEFLFPYPASGSGSAAGVTGSPDGYLWGFIDLVFRHRGRYYLLDWKSNHLDDYARTDLDRSMKESRYDLQYMLYSLALDKWLRSLIQDYEYETHFGGIYYAYLRGMQAFGDRDGSIAPPVVSGTSPDVSGVFALRPTPAQMRGDFPLHLAKVMGLAGTGGRINASLLLGQEATSKNEPGSKEVGA